MWEMVKNWKRVFKLEKMVSDVEKRGQILEYDTIVTNSRQSI